MANSVKDDLWKLKRKVIDQNKYRKLVAYFEVFLKNYKYSFMKKEQEILCNAQKIIEQKVANLEIEILNNGEDFDTSKIIK